MEIQQKSVMEENTLKEINQIVTDILAPNTESFNATINYEDNKPVSIHVIAVLGWDNILKRPNRFIATLSLEHLNNYLKSGTIKDELLRARQMFYGR